MSGLKPFWRYFGGKWRAAPKYPKPLHDTIVEPFAGAAGYSLRYPERKVVLVEKYPVVAEIWRYLIRVRSEEILRIPCVEDVADLPAWVPDGARWIIGFYMNKAVAAPRRRLSSGSRKDLARGLKNRGWNPTTRMHVASQVRHIRHWRVIEGDFTKAPDIRATWFVDPPYQGAGENYVHSFSPTDFRRLAGWCRARRGQVTVCENVGAQWLPFRAFLSASRNAMTGQTSQEAIWYAVDGQEIVL